MLFMAYSQNKTPLQPSPPLHFLQEELDLGPQKARELLSQSAEKKWLMIIEQRQRRQHRHADDLSLEMTQRNLADWCRRLPDAYALPLAVQQLEALAVALRTESFRWVGVFFL